MPLMTEILQNVGTTTMAEKKLRAMTIETIGSIFAAIADCENKENFKGSVMHVTSALATALQSKLSDDDP